MKKLLVAVLLLGTTLFGVQGVQAANEAMPRALAVPCAECGAMVIASTISSRTVNTTQNCVHGKSGKDNVRITYTTYELSCSGHYYERFEQKTSTTIISCAGK